MQTLVANNKMRMLRQNLKLRKLPQRQLQLQQLRKRPIVKPVKRQKMSDARLRRLSVIVSARKRKIRMQSATPRRKPAKRNWQNNLSSRA